MLYVGPQGQAVREALGEVPVITDGPLPAEEVSRRFAAMDIYFAAYADGVSTRRGALMAGLQHGAAIVGTKGTLTDDILRESDGEAFLLADAGAPDALNAHVLRLVGDAALRERLGQGARRLYETQFSWPVISSRLLQALTKPGRPVEPALITQPHGTGS